MEIQVGDEYIIEQVSTCCVREKERIVRCKDCIRSKPSEYWEGLYDCRFIQVSMPPDAFCSMGERREA